MKAKRLKLDLSQIAYILWIAYFTAIYMFGNVYYQMPALFSYIMAIVMFGYKLLRGHKTKTVSFPINAAVMWYGLFYAWECIARIWTPDSVAAVSNTPYQTLRIVGILLAMDLYVISRDEVLKLIKAFCLGATAFAVWAMITSPISTYGTLLYASRTGQQRNTTGYVLCFSTMLLIYLFKESKKKYWLILSLLNFVSSLLTGSRKIIFAYIIGILLIIVGQKSVAKTIKYFAGILIALIIIIPIAYQIPYIREAFGERLLAVLDDSVYDSSIMFRNVAKENAIRIFKESPIIGNGWAAVRNSFVFRGVSIYAHNNYLEIAADYGIIGCILFFSRNVIYGFNCFRRIKRNNEFLTATIMLASMIILDWGQVSYVYVYMMVIWGIVYKFVQLECFGKREEIILNEDIVEVEKTNSDCEKEVV